MTKIDVTPEAIAKRRAAGTVPYKASPGELVKVGVQVWFTLVGLIMVGGFICLVTGCAFMFIL